MRTMGTMGIRHTNTQSVCLDADSLAVELARWLALHLPLPLELADMSPSHTAALVALRRHLKAGASGQLALVNLGPAVPAQCKPGTATIRRDRES